MIAGVSMRANRLTVPACAYGNTLLRNAYPRAANMSSASYSSSSSSSLIASGGPYTQYTGSLAFLLGLAAGGLGSLIGLGGAFFVLPFLNGYFGLTQHITSGTAFCTLVGTSTGGSLSYAMRHFQSVETTAAAATVTTTPTTKTVPTSQSTDEMKNRPVGFNWSGIPETVGDINIRTAIIIAMASSFSVILGARTSKRMNAKTLTLLQGCLQVCVAPTPLISDYLRKEQQKKKGNKKQATEAKAEAVAVVTPASQQMSFFQSLLTTESAETLLLGAGAGYIGGVFGVGGGAIVVPVLSVFTSLDYQTALGTSLAAMLPMALNGTLTHFRQGTINTRIGIPLGLGSFVGSYVGGKYGKKLGEEKLLYVFSATMLTVGARTLYKGLRLVK